MNKKRSSFSPPKTPYSFKQVTKKILAEPEFAKFIHKLVLKARGGEGDAQEAADTVALYFKPLPEELNKLKLPQSLLRHRDVNDIRCTTGHMLIDFAAPAQIWS